MEFGIGTDLALRFIPALAGNTLRTRDQALALYGSSPRLRGTPDEEAVRYISAGGSSPRMRGTHFCLPRQRARERFIPAHAGNTTGIEYRRSDSAVHPRACGEHLVMADVSRHDHRPVHPRARGEHAASCNSTAQLPGSSPRTRGTRPVPAAARTRPVHPRARGEHRIASQSATVGGSSPRTRGTPPVGNAGNRRGRFIPAHAGNTAAIVISAPGRFIPAHAGNTRCILDPVDKMQRRFIPAHAGNTSGSDKALTRAAARFIPAHAGNTLPVL